MNSERVLILFTLVGFGILAVQSLRQGQIPLPSRFVGISLVATVLAVIAMASAPLAAALGGAVLLGLLVLTVTGNPLTTPTGSERERGEFQEQPQ